MWRLSYFGQFWHDFNRSAQKVGWHWSLSPLPPAHTRITSARWPSCFLPCRGRGRCCWRLGGRQERRESRWEDKRSGGKVRDSILRREGNTIIICSRSNLSSNRRAPPPKTPTCPVVSWARAGPSRPGGCWSTTQRSYLMTIAPPLEALYFLPLPEVCARLVNTAGSSEGADDAALPFCFLLLFFLFLCALLRPPC